MTNKYVAPDEKAIAIIAKPILQAALDVFNGLDFNDSDYSEVMTATLEAFSAVKKETVRLNLDFKEKAKPIEIDSIYFDISHIVFSAFYCACMDVGIEDVHPYSKAGTWFNGLVSACIALDAYENLRGSLSGEIFGEGRADAVLAELHKD